ncbi:MAG: MFS transporter, partial [Pseudomonadota bacterium]
MLRSRWSFIIAVFVGGLLAAAQFGKIALTLPEVAAAFGRTIPEVSLLVSLVGVMGLMLGVVAGALAAGLGAGRTYLLGLVLGAALSLLQALMPPFAIFASLRVLEGIAHLALVVAGPPLMAAAASDRARPFVMGLWAVFFGASLVISAQLFPPLLRVGGLPLIFASHGAALALLAAILWPMVPKGPRNAVPLDPIA